MNLDCHYYGTYFIARQAGWEHEDACKIAWAAETVDKMTLKVLKGVYKKNKNIPRVTTILDPMDDMNSTQTFTYAYRYWIQFSWMPFHFLPEKPDSIQELPPSLESNYIYNCELNKDEKAHAKSSENIYIEDFNQICKTTTDLCNDMIRETKRIYNESKSANKDKALFRIGICMHVLADTWTHQGFSGNGDIFINKAIKDEKNTVSWDKTDSIVKFGLQRASVRDKDVFSTFYVGHFSVLHNPDIPAMDFTYIHPYSPNQPIHAKNTERFLNAFYQMYTSLCYILNANAEENNFTLKEIGGDAFDKNDDFKNRKIEKKDDSIYNILSKIFENSNKHEDEDNDKTCKNWKNLLSEIYGKNNYCPKYNLEKVDCTQLIDFLHPAEEHRNFIMEKMKCELKISVIDKIIEGLLLGKSISDIKIDREGKELNDNNSKSFRVDITDSEDNIMSYKGINAEKYDAVDITDFNNNHKMYYGKKVEIKEFKQTEYYYAFNEDNPVPNSTPLTEFSDKNTALASSNETDSGSGVNTPDSTSGAHNKGQNSLMAANIIGDSYVKEKFYKDLNWSQPSA